MNSTNSNAKQEGWRQAALHLLAAVCGVVTAWMASFSLPMNTVPDWLGKGWGICIFGLMVSGGSGFWNSILSYVKATKDIQQSQVPQTKPLAPASAV
jgi:DMSO reductase anchor subunit